MQAILASDCRNALAEVSPDQFSAEVNALHVWFIRTDCLPADLSDLCSADEHERARRFKFDNDRISSLATRASLRLILGHYSNRRPEALKFETAPYGKLLLAHDGLRIAFNVSHSGIYSLIAVTNGAAVGVDIERIRPGVGHLEIASQYFSGREVRWLSSRSEDRRLGDFYRLWVAKESVLKADGRGLSLPLNEVDIGLGERGGIPLHWFEWVIQELYLVPDYAAAVATEGGLPILRVICGRAP